MLDLTKLSKRRDWVLGILMLPIVIAIIAPDFAARVFMVLGTAPSWYIYMLGSVVFAIFGIEIKDRFKGG